MSSPRIRSPSCLLWFCCTQAAFLAMQADSLFVITCQESEVLDLILTLFVQGGRLPEADELAWCNADITYEVRLCRGCVVWSEMVRDVKQPRKLFLVVAHI